MIDQTTTADADIHYVNLDGPEPVFMERPFLTDVASWNKTSISADGVDEATFGPGIPMNTIVRVHPNQLAYQEGIPADMTVMVDDGTFEFSATVPGNYFVVIENPFPYRTMTQEIVVA